MTRIPALASLNRILGKEQMTEQPYHRRKRGIEYFHKVVLST